MKHVMFAEKSLLMGDEVADCLLEYARLLADNSTADTVTIRAISPDGNTIDVSGEDGRRQQDRTRRRLSSRSFPSTAGACAQAPAASPESA